MVRYGTVRYRMVWYDVKVWVYGMVWYLLFTFLLILYVLLFIFLIFSDFGHHHAKTTAVLAIAAIDQPLFRLFPWAAS